MDNGIKCIVILISFMIRDNTRAAMDNWLSSGKNTEFQHFSKLKT